MFAPTQASSVPASRLKTQTPHDVPLSEQALRLLGEQTTKNLYVFPGRPRAPLSTSLPGFFQGTEMPNAGWWEALWPDPAGVLAAVGVRPGMGVVDLCSGDGWFALQIAKIARHVVAIDIDPNLLEVARHRLTEAGATHCDYLAGDAYELAELVSKPVDFVFTADAFHGVPDRPRLVLAVRAALKPGGLFAIINWHQQAREETIVLGEPRGPKTELRLSLEETTEAVESSGLKLAHLVDMPPYHYGAVFEQPPARSQ